MKNIVICLDGTGNQLRARGNTNVVRLYEMLDLSRPADQIAYYDPGVGTFSAAGAWSPAGRWLTRIAGLAFGMGLRTNLGEAYSYLMSNYEPGDRLFVFGFSRGAYNGRALAGLLRTLGLMRSGSENLVPYAVKTYTGKNREWTQDDWDEIHLFAATFSRVVNQHTTIPIHYLGLWDTVKAAGILRWNLRWPWTRQMPHVRHGRHAVSIDERRRPYREYLFTPRGSASQDPIEEVWFAGVHSDIGGSFEDDPRLGQITLKWIAQDAASHGLLLRRKPFENACNAVGPTSALGEVHQMGPLWRILTTRRRPVPAEATVHASVEARCSAIPGYGSAIPSTVRWTDPDWDQASSDGSRQQPQRPDEGSAQDVSGTPEPLRASRDSAPKQLP